MARSSSGSFKRIHPGITKRDKTTGRILKIHGEASFGSEVRASKEYSTWSGMKKRCYNKNMTGYDNYGAVGIKVCKRWRDSYLAFLEDMGRAPSKSHSIDRINNNKMYSPSNCKWSTPHEQSQNKSTVALNKYLVQYIRQRNATAKVIIKELNDICRQPNISRIKNGIRWPNV